MTKALEAALIELSNVKDSFNEDDIERLFQSVYLELGYSTVGRDILGKRELEKSIAVFPESVTESLKGKSLPDRDDLARLVVASNLSKTLSGKKVSEETMLDGQIVLRIGKAELRVKREELATFVKRVLALRGTVDTQDFLALEVPINSKDQTRYLEILAAWEKEAATLSGEIEKLEAELNEVVYTVYGLNSADREVIEEFLRRF